MEGFNWTEWTLFATESGNGEYYERYTHDPVTVNGIERHLDFNYWKFQPDRSVFDLWEKCQDEVPDRMRYRMRYRTERMRPDTFLGVEFLEVLVDHLGDEVPVALVDGLADAAQRLSRLDLLHELDVRWTS